MPCHPGVTHGAQPDRGCQQPPGTARPWPPAAAARSRGVVEGLSGGGKAKPSPHLRLRDREEGLAPSGVEAGEVRIWNGHAAHLEAGTQAQVGPSCSERGGKGDQEEEMEQEGLRCGEGRAGAVRLLVFIAVG